MKNPLFDYEPEPLDARKGKGGSPAGKRPTIGSQSTVARTVKRAPEVMVKISSSAKNMKKVQANAKYISRDGTVPLENEQGNTYLGEDAVNDALHPWGKSIPASGEKRRETFNVIFSMPAGTPRKEVTEAVRQFAAETFANHQYLFATHNDEDHPHVHVIVKASPLKGRKRLNPRKADLQKWRELFAAKLIGQGIEANATPRAARGVTKKATQQAVIHINERSQTDRARQPARVTQGQTQAAVDELNGKPKPEPFKPLLIEQRKQVLTEYGMVARELQKGTESDRALAVAVTRFAQTLPPVQTQHEKLVAELQKAQEQGKGLER